MRCLKCGEVWDQTENVGFEEGSLAWIWDDELKIEVRDLELVVAKLGLE